MKQRYLVPATFWDDHWDRSPCDEPDTGMCNEVRRVGRHQVLIEGTAVQVECLRADAQQFADSTPTWATKALIRSAYATLGALQRPIKD